MVTKVPISLDPFVDSLKPQDWIETNGWKPLFLNSEEEWGSRDKPRFKYFPISLDTPTTVVGLICHFSHWCFGIWVFCPLSTGDCLAPPPALNHLLLLHHLFTPPSPYLPPPPPTPRWWKEYWCFPFFRLGKCGGGASDGWGTVSITGKGRFREGKKLSGRRGSFRHFSEQKMSSSQCSC